MDPDTLTNERTLAHASALFARIFVPVDLMTGDSFRALAVALELQRTYGSRICLFKNAESDTTDDFLGGIGSPAAYGDLVGETKARLRRFIDNVAPGHDGDVEIRSSMGGSVVELTQSEARRWDATLIIVSASVHSRLLRSDAEKIVHDVHIPVMVLPPTPPERVTYPPRRPLTPNDRI